MYVLAKKFGNDTNDGVALATSNLQLARLKNKKPASKISGKDGFSEVPLHPSAATLAAVILADGTDEGRAAVERIDRGQVQRGKAPMVEIVEGNGRNSENLTPTINLLFCVAKELQ